MLTLELFEELQGPPEPTLIDALRDFLPLAVKHLKIKELPKIKLLGDVETDHMPSFGKFSNDDRTVHLGIKNRHPNDILRTLAHEMVHYVQGEQDRLDADSGATGSTEEDEANAEAGVIMREFNQQFPQYMSLKPIMVEKWTQKYKKSINCSNPKGFSQKAHCQGRKKANENFADGEVKEGLGNWLKNKFDPNNIPGFTDIYNKIKPYVVKDIINKIPKDKFGAPTMGFGFWAIASFEMGEHDDAIKDSVENFLIQTLGKEQAYRFVQNKKLINAIVTQLQVDIGGELINFKKKYTEKGVVENFADGKGPGRPGDSQRHGIPKGATMAQLEKAAKAPGRKGQLARWQINMRRGRKK
jgi:hypothetical protein